MNGSGGIFDAILALVRGASRRRLTADLRGTGGDGCGRERGRGKGKGGGRRGEGEKGSMYEVQWNTLYVVQKATRAKMNSIDLFILWHCDFDLQLNKVM